MSTSKSQGFDSPDPIPLVGEVRALRTFDLRRDGGLYPVTMSRTGAWTAGDNEAHCRRHERAGAKGCECGFWAYGSTKGMWEQRQSMNIIAAVSCWGRITPGRRGIRAQHARVDALWLSQRVPEDLVEAARARYPRTAIFRNKDAMLAEFPPTQLASYGPADARRMARVAMLWVARAVVAAMLFASLAFSLGWLHDAGLGGVPAVLTGFGFLDFAFTAVLLWATGRRRRVAAYERAAAGLAAAALWEAAPFLPWWGDAIARLPLVWVAARWLMEVTVRYRPGWVGRGVRR